MLITARVAVNFIAAIQAALLSFYYNQRSTEYLYPKQTNVPDKAIYDFIVVGAGTSGCVIANRLVEAGYEVLLIEAGGVPGIDSNYPSTMLYLKESYSSWNYTFDGYGIISESHKRLKDELSQGKMLGGDSSLSYNIYTPGVYLDYDNWARILRDESWSWKNVLPFFKKSQKLEDKTIKDSPDGSYFGTHGNIGLTTDRTTLDKRLLKAFKEMGNNIVLSLNGNRTEGYTETLFPIDNGMRQSTANTYLTKLKDNPKLHVLRNTVVKRVQFDIFKRATGVEAYTYDKRDICIRARKEIIISAGAIGSPKLLILSGIGPLEELIKHFIKPICILPVGKNLQTHILVSVIHNITTLINPYEPWNPQKFPASTLIGLAKLNKKKSYPLCQTASFANFPLLNMRYCVMTYGLNNIICDNLLRTKVNSQTIYTIVSLQPVQSRGSVTLRSNLFHEEPFVSFNIFSAPEDLVSLAKCVKHFYGIGKTPTFKEMKVKFKDPKLVKCSGLDRESHEYWECYTSLMANPEFHFTSTCAMGWVVDTRLRVYGVKGLRVADASVMPHPTAGGTLASTIMIGEKAADMIINDHMIPI